MSLLLLAFVLALRLATPAWAGPDPAAVATRMLAALRGLALQLGLDAVAWRTGASAREGSRAPPEVAYAPAPEAVPSSGGELPAAPAPPVTSETQYRKELGLLPRLSYVDIASGSLQ